MGIPSLIQVIGACTRTSLIVTNSKPKEAHQFHGEFMHSVIQLKLFKCVCNFALVMTSEGYTL